MNMISTETHRSPNLSDLDQRQAAAVTTLNEQIAKLNAAVAQAVDSGLTIELTRASRHHSPQRCWGDQMSPRISRV